MGGPGGEQNVEANKHCQRFAELIGELGWRQRGRLDQKLEGRLRTRGKKAEKNRDINADIIFTFYCPFTRGQRGVLVDGKRYAMDSLTTPNIQNFVEKNLIDIDNLRQSRDVLETDLEIDPLTHFDTAIVAIYCHKEWDAAEMRKVLAKVQPPGYRKQPVISLVATNDTLSRLNTIYLFKKSCAKLEFFYMTGGNPLYSSVLAPEYLFSSLIPFRYQLHDSPRVIRYGIFNFDTVSPYPSKVRFLLGFARRVFASQTEINILAMMSAGQFVTFEQELNAELRLDKDGPALDDGTIRPDYKATCIDETAYKI